MLYKGGIFFVVIVLIRWFWTGGEDRSLAGLLVEAAFSTVLFLIFTYVIEQFIARRAGRDGQEVKKGE